MSTSTKKEIKSNGLPVIFCMNIIYLDLLNSSCSFNAFARRTPAGGWAWYSNFLKCKFYSICVNKLSKRNKQASFAVNVLKWSQSAKDCVLWKPLRRIVYSEKAKVRARKVIEQLLIHWIGRNWFSRNRIISSV